MDPHFRSCVRSRRHENKQAAQPRNSEIAPSLTLSLMDPLWKTGPPLTNPKPSTLNPEEETLQVKRRVCLRFLWRCSHEPETILEMRVSWPALALRLCTSEVCWHSASASQHVTFTGREPKDGEPQYVATNEVSTKEARGGFVTVTAERDNWYRKNGLSTIHSSIPQLLTSILNLNPQHATTNMQHRSSAMAAAYRPTRM